MFGGPCADHDATNAMSTPKRARSDVPAEQCDDEQPLSDSPKSKNLKVNHETYETMPKAKTLDLNASSNSIEGIIVEETQEKAQNDVVGTTCHTLREDQVNGEDGNQSGDCIIVSEHAQNVPTDPPESVSHAQNVPTDPPESVSQVQKESPWQEAMSSIPSRLHYIYNHPEFTDCVVHTGNGCAQKSFHVHQFMLFITSAKFKELLTSKGDNPELVLPDISPSQFEILLRYIYLGVLFVDSGKEAIDMYKLGIKYGIPHISMLAKALAVRSLDPENVWNLLALAIEYKDNNIVVECCAFLSKTPLAWLHLHPSVSNGTLAKVLSLTYLEVPEIEVLKAVDLWSTGVCNQLGIEVSSENKRKVVGSEVLSKIRFMAITPEEFLKFSFTSGNSAPEVPNSFLTMTETFAILANLNSPGCVQLPSYLSMVSDQRGFMKLRVVRKANFTFVLGAEQYASSYPVPHCSAGSKNFATFLTVDHRIFFHGIQIPTFVDAHLNTRSTYHETYKIEISDSENNIIARDVRSVDAIYSSAVDIVLTKSIVLEPNIPYKISLSTVNTYFLLKMFRQVEVLRNIQFSFKDCFIPESPGKEVPRPSSHGFILQIIFSELI